MMFCANFCWKVGNFQPWQSIWCGRCYTLSDSIKFHIRTKPIEDEDEGRFERAWSSQWEDDQHQSARDGDHLITPFECDQCIFLKLKGRLPVLEDDSDKKLLHALDELTLTLFGPEALQPCLII